MASNIAYSDCFSSINTSGATIIGGSLVAFGSAAAGFVAVAADDIPAGEVGLYVFSGSVVQAAKLNAADSWAVGAVLFAVPASGLLTTTSTDNIRAGRAPHASAAGDTTASLVLNLA